MKDRNRLKLYTGPIPPGPRKVAILAARAADREDLFQPGDSTCEAKELRGFALLMSNAGQHGLAEVLMRQAKEAFRKAA